MKSNELSQSYLFKSKARSKILEVLMEEKSYSDVIRESQEIVELCQKAILRRIGIEPPKWHDVSDIIEENISFFPDQFHQLIREILPSAKWLRAERELAFYGDIDFIPTDEYNIDDAKKSMNAARSWIELCEKLLDS
ncbi:MAG TPA: HEPN domain-containing protein [Bacteroidota bacterium]|jgi:HEPN domain-containing protein|nr:HEPN domain-containing protein [Bacteroidota bacterium]